MNTITQITSYSSQRNALLNAQQALKDSVSREYASRRVFPCWSRMVVKTAVKSIRQLEIIKQDIL